MKRQLGPILVVFALLCVPAAWSQSGSPDSSQSGSTDASQNGSSDQSANGTAQSGSTDSSSNGSNQDGSTPSAQGIFTQSGAGDSQSGSSQSGLGDSSQQQAVTGPQATFTHPETLPPLSMLNEVTSNTGMQFTLATGIAADSNAAGTATSNWQGLATVYGTFGITQIRPKVNWSLAYGGGTNQYLGGSNNYNSVTQAGTAGVLWQLAQHWQLTLHDSYIYSSDPFQPYLTINSVPTFNDPNPTIYLPQSTFQTNTGTVDLLYQLGAHDTIDVSGFENFMRYQGSLLLSQQSSYMWAGSSFYQHVFTARFSGGGGYEFSALDFGHGESRAGVQTFEGFASYKITPSMSVTGWLGPEETHTKDIVPLFCIPGFGCEYQVIHTSVFNIAEGANFNWSGAHNAFRAKFSHRVTNGGGLLGAVRLYLFTADYRRVLNSRWVLSSNVLYGNNLSISFLSGGNEYLNSITGQIGVARSLTPSWTATAYYALIDQKQNNIPGYTTPHWIDNRFTIAFLYNWGHSLGR